MVCQPYNSPFDTDINLQSYVQKYEKHSRLLACVVVPYTIQSIGNAFEQQGDRNTHQAKN